VLSQINITQEEQKVIDENVARLRQGVEVWNDWREQNHEIAIDLRGVNLQREMLSDFNLNNTDLGGTNLSGANLSHAMLNRSNLSGSNLICANLNDADLSDAVLNGANLNNADLRGANLGGASLNCARLDHSNLGGTNFNMAKLSSALLRSVDLSKAALNRTDLSKASLDQSNLSESSLNRANLNKANLCGADLSMSDLSYANFNGAFLNSANLSGANLSNTNFTESNISGVKWNPRKMRGKYMGIRGIDSSYGNALFKRAAADQDYLDTLENHWKGNKWLTYLFKMWGWIDYGRSIERVVAIACITMFLFGLTYSIFPELLGLDCMPDTQGCNRHSCFTPFYFSIVTFTTLGFGDITPKNLVGELIVSFEVILGYAVLGLLISVLADKVVRRS
jgi:uncharacterized protein YjbI with pentapeptide repeats